MKTDERTDERTRSISASAAIELTFPISCPNTSNTSGQNLHLSFAKSSFLRYPIRGFSPNLMQDLSDLSSFFLKITLKILLQMSGLSGF